MKCYNCSGNVESDIIKKFKRDCTKYKIDLEADKKYILCYCCNRLRESCQ